MSSLAALHPGVQSYLESQHQGGINDAAIEPCGRLIGTCGDDGVVNIFSLPAEGSTSGTQMQRIAYLAGVHNGPVIRLAWVSKPPGNNGQVTIRGAFLASAGVDSQVVIWYCSDVLSASSPTWQAVCTRSFAAPAIALSWAPSEFGFTLACACADGRVNLIDNTNPQDPSSWGGTSFEAHILSGCTGVCWAPYLPPGSLLTMPLNQVQMMAAQQGGPASSTLQVPNPVPRLVTSGFEKTLRIWKFSRVDKHWVHEHDLILQGSDDETVRDVSWAPNVGAPFSYIAAGGTSGRVCVWLQDGLEGMWRCMPLPTFPAPVCRVHWSQLGTFLNITLADGSCSIWKEQPSGDWEEMALIEGGVAE